MHRNMCRILLKLSITCNFPILYFVSSQRGESRPRKRVLTNVAWVVGNNKVLAGINSSFVIARTSFLLLRSVFVQLFPFPLSDT